MILYMHMYVYIYIYICLITTLIKDNDVSIYHIYETTIECILQLIL